MLTEICQYLRNWFTRRDGLHVGSYTITGGTLPLDFSAPYVRIVGSMFNDGVYPVENGCVSGLHDEAFDGGVWAMAIPPAVVALAAEIENWCEDNAAALKSPYTSESFGGYSYSLRSGYSAQGGENEPVGWQNQFKARLAPWRKI